MKLLGRGQPNERSIQDKAVMIQELASLRQRIAGLERSESERKRVEEALRESEERYNVIFDRSLDCIYVVDI